MSVVAVAHAYSCDTRLGRSIPSPWIIACRKEATPSSPKTGATDTRSAVACHHAEIGGTSLATAS
jgi:hypothetical protein